MEPLVLAMLCIVMFVILIITMCKAGGELGALILIIVVLMFLFVGEPDLFDALRENLINQVKVKP